MDFEIVKEFLGRRLIKYKCDVCSAPLESPVDDAGKSDTCPVCHTCFTVPGLEALQVAEAAKKQPELEEAEERLRRLQPEAIEQQNPLPPPPPPPPQPPKLVWRGNMYCRSCGYRWMSRRNTPPAHCAGCHGHNVEPVMAPPGCLTILLLAIGLALLSVAVH